MMRDNKSSNFSYFGGWSRHRYPFLRVLSGVIWDYPVPCNLSVWWNFGSLLGFCLVVQIVTGLLLAMHYTPHVDHAFNSVMHIIRDVNEGWFLRSIHINFASGFFFCLYCHIGRGIYYGSVDFKKVWLTGVTLYLLVCAEAFFGYVLPWGQMSYWGATVITSMLTVIPWCGTLLTEFFWGGYSVGNPTLQRFYVIHFLLPFLISGVVVLHIYYLHQEDSNCPLGGLEMVQMVPFHPYYTLKDLTGVLAFCFMMNFFVLVYPDTFLACENWLKANPMKTPLNIKPEWYFLFAYAILRSIPHKTGGIVIMGCSILVLYLFPFFNWGKMRSGAFYPVFQLVFWCWVVVFLLLTLTGHAHVRPVFIVFGQYLTCFYFGLIFLMVYSQLFWDYILSVGAGKPLPKSMTEKKESYVSKSQVGGEFKHWKWS